MSKFTVVPEENSEGWESYRRLVNDTHRRHNEWLMDLANKQHEQDVKIAVLTTKVTIYAALASGVAAIAGNVISKMLTS